MTRTTSVLAVLVAVGVLVSVCCGDTDDATDQVRVFSTPKLRRFAHLTDQDFLRSELSEHFAVVRVSGTRQNAAVRARIVQLLSQLEEEAAAAGLAGAWRIDEDGFEAETPFGSKRFVNVIATFNPQRAERRLLLAAHYDSKFFLPDANGGEFVGVTDSALPCVMLLELARSLNSRLLRAAAERRDWRGPALQLVFFDGEEAFVNWSERDSLYGARHLAERWERDGQLPGIDALVLLDLIGAAGMQFLNHFADTSHMYAELRDIEERLGVVAYRDRHFFPAQRLASDHYRVEDDHLPFLRRGVPVLHLITFPFPSVWHTYADNLDVVNWDDTFLLQSVLRIFVAQRLLL